MAAPQFVFIVIAHKNPLVLGGMESSILHIFTQLLHIYCLKTKLLKFFLCFAFRSIHITDTDMENHTTIKPIVMLTCFTLGITYVTFYACWLQSQYYCNLFFLFFTFDCFIYVYIHSQNNLHFV